jgi:hypothetical protein
MVKSNALHYKAMTAKLKDESTPKKLKKNVGIKNTKEINWAV